MRIVHSRANRKQLSEVLNVSKSYFTEGFYTTCLTPKIWFYLRSSIYSLNTTMPERWRKNRYKFLWICSSVPLRAPHASFHHPHGPSALQLSSSARKALYSLTAILYQRSAISAATSSPSAHFPSSLEFGVRFELQGSLCGNSSFSPPSLLSPPLLFSPPPLLPK